MSKLACFIELSIKKYKRTSLIFSSFTELQALAIRLHRDLSYARGPFFNSYCNRLHTACAGSVAALRRAFPWIRQCFPPGGPGCSRPPAAR